jgi:DNA-binding XRE family transcriptional regulator
VFELEFDSAKFKAFLASRPDIRQSGLAQILGVSTRTLRYWGEGKLEPKPHQLTAICSLYGLDEMSLLKRVYKPKRHPLMQEKEE